MASTFFKFFFYIITYISYDVSIRVLFPTNLITDESFAETQFDVVKHSVKPEAYNDDELPEKLRRVLIGARERDPVTAFPHWYSLKTSSIIFFLTTPPLENRVRK